MEDKIIVFSVTAHESHQAINDLVKSILHSHKNSYIVIHVTQMWVGFDETQINLLNKHVFINTTRYNIRDKYWGKAGCHVSNMEFFNLLNKEYDFLIITDSNELFLRKIDINYLNEHKYGSCHNRTPTDHIIRNAILPPELYEINGRWNGYPHGMFMTFSIVTKMVNNYRKYYGNRVNIFNCDEEQLLHTILYNIVDDNGIGSLTDYRGGDDIHIDSLIEFMKTNKTADTIYNWPVVTDNVTFSIKPIERTNRKTRDVLIKLIDND